MFDIERVRTGWQREAAAIDAAVLTINDLTAAEPVRADGWTSHDLLGHISNAARGFLAYIRGDVSGVLNVDEWNEQQRERGRQRAWTDVQQYWERARDEVTNFLAEADNSLAERPVQLSHLPQVKNAGDVLRVLILHTRSHREELEQAFPPVQA
jgi:uncharacterized protein (TIGR03083 family)